MKTKAVCCKEEGHDYAFSTVTFQRDGSGNAFQGFGQRIAAQFQTWVCRKCGQAIEIQVRPALAHREMPENLRRPQPSKKEPQPATVQAASA